jgi:geranylgeranyl pyrophosphate synthase
MKNTIENSLFDKLSVLLSISVKQPKFLYLLVKATREHRTVEERFTELLSQCKCANNAVYPNRKLSDIKYFEKNFFSILFLSTFISAGIEKESRIKYGVIIHAIRTIITCTDNILDDEDKGTVFLNAGIDNRVLDGIMLSLLCQKMISDTIRDVVNHKSKSGQIESELLDSICSVAKGETLAAPSRNNQIKTPEDIIENIHKKIGGELLRLALVVPLRNEKNLSDPMRYIEAGILKIGLALQMLDDVTDFVEDVNQGKANLLASVIIYKSLDGIYSIEQLQAMTAKEQIETGECFKQSQSFAVNMSMAKAIEGFDLLSKADFPINHEQSIDIIKLMFHLRGLDNEWMQSEYE